MEIAFNDIPYISLLILALIKYNNFSEIKDEICKSQKFPIRLVLLLLTILILSSIIEFNIGHYFILLLFLVMSIILDGESKDIKNKQTLDDKLLTYTLFLCGTFIVTSCYLSKKDMVKILFIIFGLCILFSINYLVLVTSDPSKKYKLKKMIKNCIIGAIVPGLMLLWCEYERKPLVKYVKLFYRKQ
jgi:hypothetical protein